MNTISAMQNAVDYIETNIKEELFAETVAKAANMSAFHFQRLFSVFFGITLGEYIRNRRLSLAAEEIMATDKKLIDIAFDFGYKTPESFSRAFYRYFGVTPSVIRNRNCALKLFPAISAKSILSGDNLMTNLNERGYSVLENRPIYYTRNMDVTVKWFKDILGWYGGVDARDDGGNGTYGCVLPIPGELVHMKVAEFNGIHLFPGEPSKRVEGLILVDSIEKLHGFATNNGWDDITEISHQPWGARMCGITSVDGTIINFFELD